MKIATRVRAVAAAAALMAATQGCAAAARLPAMAGLSGPGMRECAPYMLSGAALGVEAGLAESSNRNERIRRGTTGAAAGAVVGYAVCVEVWRQKQELDSLVTVLEGGAAPGERVVRDVRVVENRELHLDLDLKFATGQSRLEPRVTSHLQAIASNLQARPNSDVHVVGHTDSSGDAARNRTLSRNRAESVAAYLVEQGVDRARLVTEGKGSEEPIADNGSPEGRALNRRVQIIIKPTET